MEFPTVALACFKQVIGAKFAGRIFALQNLIAFLPGKTPVNSCQFPCLAVQVQQLIGHRIRYIANIILIIHGQRGKIVMLHHYCPHDGIPQKNRCCLCRVQEDFKLTAVIFK